MRKNWVKGWIAFAGFWFGFACSLATETVEHQSMLKDFSQDGADLEASGWKTWSPRPPLLPRCYVDTVCFRSAPSALAISGNSNAAAYGGWTFPFRDLKPGQHYRLTAYFKTRAVAQPHRQVVARVDWRGKDGQRVGQPDYVFKVEPAGNAWKRLAMEVPAPKGASEARLELALGWSPQGTVWWDDISWEEVPAPESRLVRLGLVSLRPQNTGSRYGSLQAFLKALDQVAAGRPDLVCLGEGITMVGNSASYADLAEPLPGPTTRALGEKARQHHMYVVAGLYEREGEALYNTAVLIDREGRLAGKYRKVYLPREEIEGGLTPGVTFPVFEADFGRIGIMICWDSEYADPARALAYQGAEIILLPIWGGYMKLMQARALENHLYLLSSGYDVETALIDPLGEVLFSTKESGVYRTFSIDLNQRFADPWLGDMRGRFHKELHWDNPSLIQENE
jgi:predicted amidohydrolase